MLIRLMVILLQHIHSVVPCYLQSRFPEFQLPMVNFGLKILNGKFHE